MNTCGSYRPGHDTHWIQASKSWEPGQPLIEVTVREVYDDGRLDIEGQDLKTTLWQHDPARLRKSLIPDWQALWQPRFHLLRVYPGTLFNVARLEEVTGCVRSAQRYFAIHQITAVPGAGE